VISGGKPGPHKIQGIGAGFIPKNLDTSLLTGVETVTNDEAFTWARRLASEEGILGGISTGANVAAAARLAAKAENRGKVIVTVAASFGERYLSTPLFQGLGNEAVPATAAPAAAASKVVFAAANASQTLKGSATAINPALVCQERMLGTPKTVAECSSHANMPGCMASAR